MNKEFMKILKKYHKVAFKKWKKEIDEPLNKEDENICWWDLVDGAEDLHDFYYVVKPIIEKQAKQELRQEVINQINRGLSLDLIKKNLENELKQEEEE